jgi:hypothetical protein
MGSECISSSGPISSVRSSSGPISSGSISSGRSSSGVSLLSDYIRHAALRADEPLMMYQGRHMNTKIISEVMKTCAVAHDIDPDRVVPACLRKNVITQMDLNTPQLQEAVAGGLAIECRGGELLGEPPSSR